MIHNPTIKVWPTKRAYYKVLSHPKSGALRERDAEGGTSWHNDQYTKRLIAQGSLSLEPVKLEEEK